MESSLNMLKYLLRVKVNYVQLKPIIPIPLVMESHAASRMVPYSLYCALYHGKGAIWDVSPMWRSNNEG